MDSYNYTDALSLYVLIIVSIESPQLTVIALQSLQPFFIMWQDHHIW